MWIQFCCVSGNAKKKSGDISPFAAAWKCGRLVGREVQIINEILNSSVDGSKYPESDCKGVEGVELL